MSWIGDREYRPLVQADVDQFRPLHDFVVVRPHPPADLIINPGVIMTKGGVWRQPRQRGSMTGEVISVGPGDKIVRFHCSICDTDRQRIVREDLKTKRKKCSCGYDLSTTYAHEGVADVFRADMAVKPGDVVVYTDSLANHIEINGERLHVLHAEQHVLAVIEQEIAKA